MSRQYDAYMEGRFEIYGTEYSVVEPSNFGELMKAMEVRDAIQTYLNGLMHDEDPGNFENVLQEQEDYIQEYLDGIEDFDNSILVDNISYLAKKYNLRIGEVEKMLGISTGYISRIANEKSGKKLSIDVVWKISKLFEITIHDLICRDLRIPGSNTELLLQFLSKLRKDTNEDKIYWRFEGGYETEVDERYVDMKLVGEIPEDDDVSEYSYYYYPQDHLNPKMRWFVGGSIICTKKFSGNKDLVMIPLSIESQQRIYGVDCYLVWKDQNKWKWQKVFYSNETPMSAIDEVSKAFYESIIETEFDDKVSLSVKNIIADYLRGGE